MSLNLEQQRKRAKELKRARNITLSQAQFLIAREAGFSSWPAMKHYIQDRDLDVPEAIIDAAFAGDPGFVVHRRRSRGDFPDRVAQLPAGAVLLPQVRRAEGVGASGAAGHGFR